MRDLHASPYTVLSGGLEHLEDLEFEKEVCVFIYR
jgi:hypothetical protein